MKEKLVLAPPFFEREKQRLLRSYVAEDLVLNYSYIPLGSIFQKNSIDGFSQIVI
jgi:hypothetical protein